MELSHDLEKGLIAGVFGLVGTLFPVLIAWTHDRDINSLRMRKLDEAIKRVAFWDQWLKLSIQLADPTDAAAIQRIEKELALLGRVLETDSFDFHEQLANQQSTAVQFKQVRRRLPFWRRWFLLYTPERSLAWFPRILFYLAFPVFALIAVVGTDLRADRDTVIGAVFFCLMLVVWIVVFRSLSRWLEQPHSTHLSIAEQLTPPVSPVPPPPRP
jgi:hypothetical protein